MQIVKDYIPEMPTIDVGEPNASGEGWNRGEVHLQAVPDDNLRRYAWCPFGEILFENTKVAPSTVVDVLLLLIEQVQEDTLLSSACQQRQEYRRLAMMYADLE